MLLLSFAHGALSKDNGFSCRSLLLEKHCSQKLKLQHSFVVTSGLYSASTVGLASFVPWRQTTNLDFYPIILCTHPFFVTRNLHSGEDKSAVFGVSRIRFTMLKSSLALAV